MSDILKRRVERLELQAQVQHQGGTLFAIIGEGETREAATARTAAELGQSADAFGTVITLELVRPAAPVAEVDR